MEDSKLVALLRSFSGEELAEFEDFIRSPFYNQRVELLPFYQALRAWAPDFPSDRLDEQAAFRAACPEGDFDKKQLAYLMSYLLRLAEEYVAVRRFRQSPVRETLYRLSEMTDRRLEPHYRYYLRNARELLSEQEVEDGQTFLRRYRLAEIENQHFYQQDKRRFDHHIQAASDELDRFYYATKLRLLCEMIGRERLFKKSYQIRFLAEVIHVAGGAELLQTPGVRVYYLILRMLTEEEPEGYYEEVSRLFETHFEKFTRIDRQDILSHALNFCIRQIRLRPDKKRFMEEALRLYMFGIEKGILLDQGLLSPWHFKNVVKLAFNLQRLEWAEHFIREYAEKLPVAARENALYYNLAELNYHRGDYDEALHFLHQLAFTDIHYQLNTRVLLLKIFYQLEEEETLLSNLAAFTIFLKRNKAISTDLRKTYENFCSLLHKILRRNPRKYESLREQIRTQTPLTDREWLLRTLEKEKENYQRR